MAYDKVDYKIENFTFAEQIFCRENKFNNEREFTLSLTDKLPCIIYHMYGLECKEYFKERLFKLKEFGLINTRCDLLYLTKENINIIIECKNPTHDKAETFNTIGQMIAYRINMDSMKGNNKLILATSLFDYNMLYAIKKYNIEFDLILHNIKTTAFTLFKDL